jgi:hypothetical protein
MRALALPLLLVTIGGACRGRDAGAQPEAVVSPNGGAVASTPAVAVEPAPSGTATATAMTARHQPGADFIADAKLLYRIAACGGEDAIDPAITAIVDHHCKQIRDKLASFRDEYIVKGRAWFDKVEPADLPTTVVYPFGGGDLLSALVAFPNATEVTTVSLELAGDPRRLRTLTPARLEVSLGALRAEIGGLISVGSNTSENLSAQQQNDLPGQVSSFLLGLVAAGFEPVAMRYFTIDETGNLHYLEQSEIDALDQAEAKKLKKDWKSPNFSPAFANVELQYRRPNDSRIRVHRHIAWNLSNDYLKKHPELAHHLELKGRVTVLVKGASYLLWRGDFSTVRNYLLDHLAWMLSDSTGIPPRYAERAHMIQETYGKYDGAFLESVQDNQNDDAFIELWKNQRHRPLPFRFGYVDKDKQAHLVVTRPHKSS